VVAGWIGLHARAGTPPAALARLQQAAATAAAVPAVREVLRTQGADVDPLDSAAYGRFVTTEAARWKRLVGAAGIERQ
jgi:tripartite-type tricarboxylate transporter receptor subunit TctC